MANACHLGNENLPEICIKFIWKGGRLHALNLSLDLVNFLLKGLIDLPFFCHAVPGQSAAVAPLVIQARSQVRFFYDSLLWIHSSVELPDSLLFTPAILIRFSLLGVQELFLLAPFEFMDVHERSFKKMKTKKRNQPTLALKSNEGWLNSHLIF